MPAWLLRELGIRLRPCPSTLGWGAASELALQQGRSPLARGGVARELLLLSEHHRRWDPVARRTVGLPHLWQPSSTQLCHANAVVGYQGSHRCPARPRQNIPKFGGL